MLELAYRYDWALSPHAFGPALRLGFGALEQLTTSIDTSPLSTAGQRGNDRLVLSPASFVLDTNVPAAHIP